MAEYSNYQTQLQGDAMDTLNKLDGKHNELTRLYERQAELIKELGKAQRMLAVWPEAFKDGLACAIYRRSAPNGIVNGVMNWRYTHAILERDDGEKREITLEHYALIKGS